MNLRVVIGVGSAAVFLALCAWVVGNLAIGAAAVLLLLALLLWILQPLIWVRVGEMETAVTFDVNRRAFRRFLPPGLHLLLFPVEQVVGIFSTGATTLKGRCSRAQTSEGVTATVDWTLVYRLEPANIQVDMRPAVARALLSGPGAMLRDLGNNCVNLLTNERTVGNSFQNGRRASFERALRGDLQDRLAPFGLLVIRFLVTGVELPPQVQASLEEAHERAVYADSEAHSLERLHEAVRKFTDTDMERLLRLRQLREMGQNGVTLHAPLVWPWMGPNSGPERGEEKGNGRFPPDLPLQGHDGRRVG